MSLAYDGASGIDRRTSIDTAFCASASGGWPRPSLIWQFWQALVLNSGPNPSRAVVVDGAITQGLRKKLLPTLKSRRRLGARLAEGRENAFWSRLLTVVAPPARASPGSALVKHGASSQAVRLKAINVAHRRRNERNIEFPERRRKIRPQSLTGQGGLNKSNYRLVDSDSLPLE